MPEKITEDVLTEKELANEIEKLNKKIHLEKKAIENYEYEMRIRNSTTERLKDLKRELLDKLDEINLRENLIKNSIEETRYLRNNFVGKATLSKSSLIRKHYQSRLNQYDESIYNPLKKQLTLVNDCKNAIDKSLALINEKMKESPDIDIFVEHSKNTYEAKLQEDNKKVNKLIEEHKNAVQNERTSLKNKLRVSNIKLKELEVSYDKLVEKFNEELTLFPDKVSQDELKADFKEKSEKFLANKNALIKSMDEYKKSLIESSSKLEYFDVIANEKNRNIKDIIDSSKEVDIKTDKLFKTSVLVNKNNTLSKAMDFLKEEFEALNSSSDYLKRIEEQSALIRKEKIIESVNNTKEKVVDNIVKATNATVDTIVKVKESAVENSVKLKNTIVTKTNDKVERVKNKIRASAISVMKHVASKANEYAKNLENEIDINSPSR